MAYFSEDLNLMWLSENSESGRTWCYAPYREAQHRRNVKLSENVDRYAGDTEDSNEEI